MPKRAVLVSSQSVTATSGTRTTPVRLHLERSLPAYLCSGTLVNVTSRGVYATYRPAPWPNFTMPSASNLATTTSELTEGSLRLVVCFAGDVATATESAID